MTSLLDKYAHIAGHEVVAHLRQLAASLKGAKVVHINSTRTGGGVAEILAKLIPLKQELGLDTHWEVISGNEQFYECTKSFHNGLQGNHVAISPKLLKNYEQTNAEYAEKVAEAVNDADFVFIHDPQPAPLLKYFPQRRGKWVWRCHIDLSHPNRPIWKYLRQFITPYDASIFSLADFAQTLPHPVYLIPPSIDPLAEKNMELTDKYIQSVQEQFNFDPTRRMMLQVSRFDRFKDPIGVIQAYQLAKTFSPGLQLVLAGGSATDDPEGAAVEAEVRLTAANDPDIHILLLPADAHRIINALQRSADFVLQKSLREGFGLTVTEAMWKGKPVIGGDTGGIRLQVINHHTGFLVSTPEGAALRIRYLLNQPDKVMEMGAKAKEFVRENFLLTRHLREYLSLMVGLQHGNQDRIEIA